MYPIRHLLVPSSLTVKPETVWRWRSPISCPHHQRATNCNEAVYAREMNKAVETALFILFCS